ncbi:MAG TPA: hypothetical protein VI298_08660 [Geobacteraceae bacterium]
MERRTEIRRSFIEGKGHLVEEVPMSRPIDPGQKVVGVSQEPARPVTIVSMEMVPLLVAMQVVHANGMVAVPRSFLSEEQLTALDLGKVHDSDQKGPAGPGDPNDTEDVTLLKADQAIIRVQLAKNFEELNALMRNEKRVTVIQAAEARAAELKESGGE